MGKPAGSRRMLQCLNSGLPLRVLPDDKICPDSDSFRGSSRAVRRKQYVRLQSKMRSSSWDSLDSEGTPDRKRRKNYQDISLLEKQIALLKDLGEDLEVIRPLQRELLQLIKAARGVDSNVEEIDDDISFQTPV